MPDQSRGQDQNTQDASFLSRLMTEFFRRIFHPVTLVACVSCSFLFAFIGPYNTYDSDTLLYRLTFWSGVVVSSCILSIFFGVLAKLLFEHKPFWFHSAIGGSLFSVVYFIFMWNVLNTVFEGKEIPHPAELFTVIVAISMLVYVCMWCFTVMLENRIADSKEPKLAPRIAPITQRPTAPTNVSLDQVLKEYSARLFDPTNLAICATGALLFAIIGPFGTYETDVFSIRLLFWSALVWCTSMCALLFGVWANLRLATRPFWFQSPIGGTVFSILYLFLIWIALRAMYPPASSPSHTEFFFVTISVTTFLYCALWVFAYPIESRILRSEAAQTIDTDAQENPASNHDPAFCPVAQFLRRLGPKAGNRLIRLAMSDHYIEAHTDTGMHLLYMRFADALDALQEANGTQVHRSHWINLDEVKDSTKDGSNFAFLMSDNVHVPVSRSRKKDLQSRGLI